MNEFTSTCVRGNLFEALFFFTIDSHISFMVNLACQPSSLSTSLVVAYSESMSPVLLPTISYGIFFPVASSNAFCQFDN